MAKLSHDASKTNPVLEAETNGPKVPLLTFRPDGERSKKIPPSRHFGAADGACRRLLARRGSARQRAHIDVSMLCFECSLALSDLTSRPQFDEGNGGKSRCKKQGPERRRASVNKSFFFPQRRRLPKVPLKKKVQRRRLAQLVPWASCSRPTRSTGIVAASTSIGHRHHCG